MPNMQDILRQAQKMQRQMLQAQEELDSVIVEGSAGGGMVMVKANGKGEILSIKIAPEAVSPDDVEMLEDAVLAGIKDAVAKANAIAQQKMSKFTGGMGMPF
jgi:DNA-binding YbaB/EbfC family protein